MAREQNNKSESHACYYVTLNVTDWIGLFVRPAYKNAIVESLNHYIETKGLVVYAWCLMTNHLHMVARTTDDFSFQSTIRALKKFLSKKIFSMMATEQDFRKTWMLERFAQSAQSLKRIEKHELWQNCSNPTHIDFLDKESLFNHIRYIHENPVRDAVVDRPSDYIYSSARNYNGQRGLLKVTVVPMADSNQTAYNELAAMLLNQEIRN